MPVPVKTLYEVMHYQPEKQIEAFQEKVRLETEEAKHEAPEFHNANTTLQEQIAKSEATIEQVEQLNQPL